MTQTPLRAVLPIAAVFAFRMLGLFMILPVFSVYAHHLSGATPLLIGLTLGVYGLTQACLQMPLGMLSDRVGRKPVILLGLCLFIAGSVIAAISTSLWGVLIGRALQGMGAIGSTLMALTADVTPESHRTKAMAMIGMTIGIAFAIALVLGPTLAHWIQVSGLFWLTAILGGLGIVFVYTVIPTPARTAAPTSLTALIKPVCTTPELLRLDFGIFCQHAILTAVFVVLPLLTHTQLNLASRHQWHLYLPSLVCAFVFMVPLIIAAEKKNLMKPIFLGSIALTGVALLLLWASHAHLWQVGLWLTLYFTGFNVLEATLPSLISKRAPTHAKGTALGVYSSAQFLGIFTGGLTGGWLYGHYGASSVFYACAGLAALWCVIASAMAGSATQAQQTPFYDTQAIKD